MIHNQEPVNLTALYNDELLAELLESLDELHSAASEGDWQAMTTMKKRELVALLHECIYTAQETIREIERQDVRPGVVLQLLEKPLPNQRQAQ